MFSVYVYDNLGKKPLPSGWNNEQCLGCNPISGSVAARAAFIQFIEDPENRMAGVKLDAGPLLKDFDTYLPAYKQIVSAFNAVAVETQIMVSDTPDSFITYADTKDGFHDTVSRLMAALPAGTPLGVVYDVEGLVSDEALWTQVYNSMISYNSHAHSVWGQQWTSYTFWGPWVGYEHGQPLYNTIRHIEWGNYFSGRQTDVTQSLSKVAQLGSAVNISIGIQLTAEDGACHSYTDCGTSLVWGSGVAQDQTLSQWAETVLLPAVQQANLTRQLDPQIPFYIESLPALMSFAANVNAGRLPCNSCSKANGDVSFCK